MLLTKFGMVGQPFPLGATPAAWISKLRRFMGSLLNPDRANPGKWRISGKILQMRGWRTFDYLAICSQIPPFPFRHPLSSKKGLSPGQTSSTPPSLPCGGVLLLTRFHSGLWWGILLSLRMFASYNGRHCPGAERAGTCSQSAPLRIRSSGAYSCDSDPAPQTSQVRVWFIFERPTQRACYASTHRSFSPWRIVRRGVP